MAISRLNFIYSSLFLVYFLSGTLGYSSGPPTKVCGSMLPGHGQPVQTSSVPANVAPSCYVPNALNTFQVKGSDTAFKGFMFQFRKNSSIYQTKGKFVLAGSSTSGIKTLTCLLENDALSHSSSALKETINFSWHSENTTGTVDLVVTLVKDFNTYWVKESFSLEQCSPQTMVTQKPTAVTQKEKEKMTTTDLNGCASVYGHFKIVLLAIIITILQIIYR